MSPHLYEPGNLNILFTVDLFNEGIDIPSRAVPLGIAGKGYRHK